MNLLHQNSYSIQIVKIYQLNECNLYYLDEFKGIGTDSNITFWTCHYVETHAKSLNMKFHTNPSLRLHVMSLWISMWSQDVVWSIG